MNPYSGNKSYLMGSADPMLSSGGDFTNADLPAFEETGAATPPASPPDSNGDCTDLNFPAVVHVEAKFDDGSKGIQWNRHSSRHEVERGATVQLKLNVVGVPADSLELHLEHANSKFASQPITNCRRRDHECRGNEFYPFSVVNIPEARYINNTMEGVKAISIPMQGKDTIPMVIHCWGSEVQNNGAQKDSRTWFLVVRGEMGGQPLEQRLPLQVMSGLRDPETRLAAARTANACNEGSSSKRRKKGVVAACQSRPLAPVDLENGQLVLRKKVDYEAPPTPPKSSEEHSIDPALVQRLRAVFARREEFELRHRGGNKRLEWLVRALEIEQQFREVHG